MRQAPLLEVAGKLHGGRVPEVCTGAQEYFRDVHDHLARIQNAIDTMRDTIGTAIQVNLSMVTIEESETTKRLAAWAAIFAVSTAMAGHLGHELRAHARAEVGLWLPHGAGRDRQCRCLAVLAFPQGGLAVIACQIGF